MREWKVPLGDAEDALVVVAEHVGSRLSVRLVSDDDTRAMLGRDVTLREEEFELRQRSCTTTTAYVNADQQYKQANRNQQTRGEQLG